MKYHYVVRRASWPYSADAWHKFRTWARAQSRFWWNHMSGPLDTFAFYASPETIEEAFDELELSEHGLCAGALVVDTDKHALPETEL